MDKKIVVYACADYGNGSVQQIGIFDSIEDIEILTGMFSKDVKISFEYETYS
jgi:hypothetical protein